jgi:GGDEF domain-containing protein
MRLLHHTTDDVDSTYQSLFDPRTRLVGAALLRDRLEMALVRAERRHRLVGLLFVHVDVPADLVAAAGKSFDLLPLIAGRLRSAVRPDDTVARVGDLDFVVVCNDLVDREDILTIMDRLETVVALRVFLDESKSSLSATIRGRVGGARDRAVDLLNEGVGPESD